MRNSNKVGVAMTSVLHPQIVQSKNAIRLATVRMATKELMAYVNQNPIAVAMENMSNIKYLITV